LADNKNTDKEPKELKKTILSIKSPGAFRVTMVKDEGFVAVIRRE
jgi:hypothetical protein